jgi:NADH-quinone oxidoreductase subunit L
MTRPLIALAVLAALGGALNLPGAAALHHWLGGVTGETEAAAFNLPIATLSTLIALAGVGLACALYRRYQAPDPLAGRLFAASSRGWRIDDLYNALFVRPFARLTAAANAADAGIFYGLDWLVTRVARGAGERLRTTQTGQLNWNVAGIVGGLIVVLLLVMLGRGA